MHFSLRHGFIALSLLLAGCIAPPKQPDLAKGNAGYVPPKKEKFAWGISSASYQYEDPAVKPGQPDYFTTDWDIMVSEGGAPQKGNALYSWTHFDKDVAGLRKIGAKYYRFSIEWARVEPEPGKFNQKAIAGYVTMAKKLKAAGIEPVVCLWHFTFPSWLYDKKKPGKSNWLYPGVEDYWKQYVSVMVKALGPQVRFYAPQNEPNGQITTAYIGAMWPPRQTLNFGNYNKAIDISAKMFREAAVIIKQQDSDAIVMSVEALPWWKKAPLNLYGWFYNFMEHNNFDHLDRVYDVCDIIGFNYYYSQQASPISMLTIGSRHGHKFSMMGWNIDPQGLYNQIAAVGKRYGRPMMITENGLASHGQKDDWKRIDYIRDHVAAINKAKADGYDVRGYFYWSLADNYEWHYGYEATFGLAKMNPKTLDREMKPSGNFYRDLIRKAAK